MVPRNKTRVDRGLWSREFNKKRFLELEFGRYADKSRLPDSLLTEIVVGVVEEVFKVSYEVVDLCPDAQPVENIEVQSATDVETDCIITCVFVSVNNKTFIQKADSCVRFDQTERDASDGTYHIPHPVAIRVF